RAPRRARAGACGCGRRSCARRLRGACGSRCGRERRCGGARPLRLDAARRTRDPQGPRRGRARARPQRPDRPRRLLRLRRHHLARDGAARRARPRGRVLPEAAPEVRHLHRRPRRADALGPHVHRRDAHLQRPPSGRARTRPRPLARWADLSDQRSCRRRRRRACDREARRQVETQGRRARRAADPRRPPERLLRDARPRGRPLPITASARPAADVADRAGRSPPSRAEVAAAAAAGRRARRSRRALRARVSAAPLPARGGRMTAARRWWRLPAVVALVAGAVLLAVESHALATSRAANEREAVRSLLVISGSKPHGASEVIGTREQALLGLDGMPALRSALDAIATKRSAKSGRARGRAEREAEQILYGLVRSDAPAATRSQAANLLGVLVLRESLQSGSAAGLKKAAGVFRRAI